MPTALHELSAMELAAAIRSRETSAQAAADACIARAASFSALNAFTHMDADAVRAAARAADRALDLGGPIGPLHGVPIAVKDNFDVAGFPATAGTPALKNNRPAANAPTVQALLDAGAILFGKVGMHELAFGITSNNGFTGAVRNPFDLSRVPGGSSGGSGAVVGARIVPASLGSDTGASVRLPANYCGVAGFRPGVGRWSRQGIVPISATRDTAGPIARSVADLALFDAIVTGDRRARVVDLAGVRLGVSRRGFWENLDPECERVANEALKMMTAAGVILVDIDLSEVMGAELQFGLTIGLYEFKRDLSAYLSAHGASVAFEEVIEGVASPDVKSLVSAFAGGASPIPDEVYRQAMDVERPRLIATYNKALEGLDAVVCPTSPLLPPPIGDDETTALNGVQVPTFFTAARNLGAITLAGFPSLSLPVGMSRSGLPVGLTFDAVTGRDRDLLALGSALEAVFPKAPAPGVHGGV
jgi:Asp-tRNA(Asn)/Glu-tRNA(Gln) amidotransferase A subunit family amidase